MNSGEWHSLADWRLTFTRYQNVRAHKFQNVALNVYVWYVPTVATGNAYGHNDNDVHLLFYV